MGITGTKTADAGAVEVHIAKIRQKTGLPIAVGFGRLAVEGSKPDIEESISTTMARSTAIIWSTYMMIALVAFIGITKLL